MSTANNAPKLTKSASANVFYTPMEADDALAATRGRDGKHIPERLVCGVIDKIGVNLRDFVAEYSLCIRLHNPLVDKLETRKNSLAFASYINGYYLNNHLTCRKNHTHGTGAQTRIDWPNTNTCTTEHAFGGYTVFPFRTLAGKTDFSSMLGMYLRSTNLANQGFHYTDGNTLAVQRGSDKHSIRGLMTALESRGVSLETRNQLDWLFASQIALKYGRTAPRDGQLKREAANFERFVNAVLANAERKVPARTAGTARGFAIAKNFEDIIAKIIPVRLSGRVEFVFLPDLLTPISTPSGADPAAFQGVVRRAFAGLLGISLGYDQNLISALKNKVKEISDRWTRELAKDKAALKALAKADIDRAKRANPTQVGTLDQVLARYNAEIDRTPFEVLVKRNVEGASDIIKVLALAAIMKDFHTRNFVPQINKIIEGKQGQAAIDAIRNAQYSVSTIPAERGKVLMTAQAQTQRDELPTSMRVQQSLRTDTYRAQLLKRLLRQMKEAFKRDKELQQLEKTNPAEAQKIKEQSIQAMNAVTQRMRTPDIAERHIVFRMVNGKPHYLFLRFPGYNALLSRVEQTLRNVRGFTRGAADNVLSYTYDKAFNMALDNGLKPPLRGTDAQKWQRRANMVARAVGKALADIIKKLPEAVKNLSVPTEDHAWLANLGFSNVKSVTLSEDKFRVKSVEIEVASGKKEVGFEASFAVLHPPTQPDKFALGFGFAYKGSHRKHKITEGWAGSLDLNASYSALPIFSMKPSEQNNVFNLVSNDAYYPMGKTATIGYTASNENEKKAKDTNVRLGAFAGVLESVTGPGILFGIRHKDENKEKGTSLNVSFDLPFIVGFATSFGWNLLESKFIQYPGHLGMSWVPTIGVSSKDKESSFSASLKTIINLQDKKEGVAPSLVFKAPISYSREFSNSPLKKISLEFFAAAQIIPSLSLYLELKTSFRPSGLLKNFEFSPFISFYMQREGVKFGEDATSNTIGVCDQPPCSVPQSNTWYTQPELGGKVRHYFFGGSVYLELDGRYRPWWSLNGLRHEATGKFEVGVKF